MNTLDPKNLALPGKSKIDLPSQKPPRHRPGEKFLMGPIPWKWLAQAAQLPGKALQVAMGLWFLAGIKGKRTVSLSGSVLMRLGVDRYAKYRGLRALEGAGLISINRQTGRNPIVTILDSGGNA